MAFNFTKLRDTLSDYFLPKVKLGHKDESSFQCGDELRETVIDQLATLFEECGETHHCLSQGFFPAQTS